jgi:phosphate:Na+ symporter
MGSEMIGMIMQMCGGLGLFLFGMKLMGDGLELAAGAKLRNLIEKLTKNKYMGALVGLVVTAVIQSSSATTVMVVGFVNAGLMNLMQAVGVIMGANIGTTVTGIMIAIKLTALAPIAIFIGVVLISFCKKTNQKHIGQIIAGFGILFMGMDIMSTAMEPLGKSTFFSNMITSFSNPVVGVLVGMIFTAVIQSSSASIGVLQALGAAGAITLPSAVYVIYGQNIGTCVTALLSSVGTNKTAKRTAVVHLLFNVIGALLFVLITYFFPFARIVEQIAPGQVMAQISIVHVCFNVLTTAILLPLSNVLIRIACRLVPGEEPVKQGARLSYLDARILSTPPIAVAQLLKEVERMGALACQNFGHAMKALLHNDESEVAIVYENEQIINFLNRGITEYLVKINSLDLEDSDRRMLGALYHVINDMERIGDHSENIAELAEVLIAGRANLSFSAASEIEEMEGLVNSILQEALTLFSERGGNPALGLRVNATEEKIDQRTNQLRDNHIERLNQGLCTATSGTVFMDLLTNMERIADHATNIAFSLEARAAQRLPAEPLSAQ